MSENVPALRVMPPGGEGETPATLELIARARASLAEARTLPDIRRVMEMASVAVDAAHRAAKLAEAQQAAAEIVEAANEAANDAAAVRIEAQARAGELLRQMAESGQRAERGRPGKMSQPVTFTDLGVGRMEAHRWQQVSAIPVETRQKYMDATNAAGQEVSTGGLIKHVRGRRAVDHAGIAAEAKRQMRAVYRGLVDLPGYRPEALVGALDRSERKNLLRALRQLPAWVDEVIRELEIHRVSDEE